MSGFVLESEYALALYCFLDRPCQRVLVATIKDVNCEFNMTEEIFEICNTQCEYSDQPTILPNIFSAGNGSNLFTIEYETDSAVVKNALIAGCT